MALLESLPRKHAHTRAIDYKGYQREDGMWDIEAHMTDTKTYKFKNNWRGEISAGEPLHEMFLRLTIDDDFIIRDVVAITENGPFKICPNITSTYKSLVGIQMGPGWRKSIRSKVGGVQGCTHLTELLFPMATVAMQTIWPLRKKNKNNLDHKHHKRPTILDTCHVWASDSPVVKENIPKYYSGKD